MEKLLKEALNTSKLSILGQFGGYIAKDAAGYEIDGGKRIFVKGGTKQLVEGEFASLQAMQQTNTVRVPQPIKTIANPREDEYVLVTEYVDLKGLSKYQAELGNQLASSISHDPDYFLVTPNTRLPGLHLHNQSCEQAANSSHVGSNGDRLPYIDQFGFEVPTCCGAIPLDNTWSSDWVQFYIRQRIEPQVAMTEEKYGDRQARKLWTQLLPKLPGFFTDVTIKPALLHGDLWSGNAAETDTGPVIFDPASFYGHSEFDLSIAAMFGGFSNAFYSAYHQLIPKAPGFEKRHQLYLLFHYLNHWNHFGSGYKSQSLAIMEKLL